MRKEPRGEAVKGFCLSGSKTTCLHRNIGDMKWLKSILLAFWIYINTPVPFDHNVYDARWWTSQWARPFGLYIRVHVIVAMSDRIYSGGSRRVSGVQACLKAGRAKRVWAQQHVWVLTEETLDVFDARRVFFEAFYFLVVYNLKVIVFCRRCRKINHVLLTSCLWFCLFFKNNRCYHGTYCTEKQ